MNDGVELILERMKTHPEEFYGEENRWSYLMDSYEKFFTEHEKDMLINAIYDMRRKEFTQRVMEKLLEETKPVEVDPDTYTIKTAGRSTWGGYKHTVENIKESAMDELNRQMRTQLNLTKIHRNPK